MPLRLVLKAAKPEIEALEGDMLDVRLRRRRRALGLLQAEAAARIGVNLWTYMKWEKDRHEPEDRFYPGIVNFLGYEPWPEPTSLAEALQSERRRRGVAIRTAAVLCGVDPGTWGRWERGEWKPTRLTLLVLDTFLGLTVAEAFPHKAR